MITRRPSPCPRHAGTPKYKIRETPSGQPRSARLVKRQAELVKRQAELVPAISITATCRLLGKSKATHYRRQHPKQPRPRTPHPTPPNALTEAERTAVLAVLTSPRFVDSSVAQMTAWAAEKAAMFLRRHPEASEVLKRMQENIRLAVRSYRFREDEGGRIATIQAIRDNAVLFSDPEAVHRFREIADILASPPNETF